MEAHAYHFDAAMSHSEFFREDHHTWKRANCDFQGYESEELFSSPDDSRRSRSPRSPRTNTSPRNPPGEARRLSFSEPRGNTSAAARNSANVTPVSHKAAQNGFHSVGHKVNHQVVKGGTDTCRGTARVPLGRSREKQLQVAERADTAPVSFASGKTAQYGIRSVYLKENRAPARERSDSSPVFRARNKAPIPPVTKKVKEREVSNGSATFVSSGTEVGEVPPGTHKKNQPRGVENDDLLSDSPADSAHKNGPQACDQSPVLAAILSEVQKTNSRLESFEQRLEKLEETAQTPSSSSSGATSDKYKRTVPTRVRVRITCSC